MARSVVDTGMKQLQRLIDFLFNPPLTAPRSTLIMRVMAGGVFLSEGILKFVYTNQGVGRFTKLGIPFPHETATFIGSLEIVGGILLIVGRREGEEEARSTPEPARAVIGASLTLLSVAGLASLAGGSPRFGASTTSLSSAGGWVGALIGNPLRSALGGFGAATVLMAMLVAAMVLFTLAAAQAFSWVLSAAQVPQALADLLAATHDNAALFLVCSIVGLVVLGSLLEGLPALLILAPLLLPMVPALGISQLHYGIVLLIAMGIGAFLPPLGVGFYIACAVARAPMGRSTRIMVPYVAVLLLGLLVVAFVPWLTLVFPRALGLVGPQG